MHRIAAFVLAPILLFPGGLVLVLSTAICGGGNYSPAIFWHHQQGRLGLSARSSDMQSKLDGPIDVGNQSVL